MLLLYHFLFLMFYFSHNTGTSHWLDPRLSKFQKKSLEDCLEDELPYGWEKISDPNYGTYFIDHVNRKTQYENPVLQAKRMSERSSQGSNNNSISNNHNHHFTNNENDDHHNMKKIQFTKNPAELCGERISTTLLKSTRGLGFTIVGGDEDNNIEEFLQIKSIVPNGPAWIDNKLCTGDILVYVNDICVLGFTHHEMVNIFQSILPGETVNLDVCRGYPLPFDPNDPNTEVVTTIAVDGLQSSDLMINVENKNRIFMDLNMDGNYNFLDLSNESQHPKHSTQKNTLTKLQSGDLSYFSNNNSNNNDLIPEILNITIVKGVLGFGFTIADSLYGQKVKKILDRQCCKNLQEGDMLLNINSVYVKNMSHNDVVQVLKECPKNIETVLKIQRGFTGGNLNGGGSKLRKSLDSIKFGSSIQTKNLFRSKTPTADIYSTQPKEILPSRPKTPLVDTRIKTPLTELNTEEIELDVAENNLNNNMHNKNNDDNKSILTEDSINNDIFPNLPKLVKNLTDRLGDVSINQDNHNHSDMKNDYYFQNGGLASGGNSSNSGYVTAPTANRNGMNSSLYSPPNQAAGAQNSYLLQNQSQFHPENCFCFDCQDYANRRQFDFHQHQQRQQQLPKYNLPPQMNDNIGKRLHDYINNRKRSISNNFDTNNFDHNTMNYPSAQSQHFNGHQQQQQVNNWKNWNVQSHSQISPVGSHYQQQQYSPHYQVKMKYKNITFKNLLN